MTALRLTAGASALSRQRAAKRRAVFWEDRLTAGPPSSIHRTETQFLSPPLAPPGATEVVAARRALVVAPHYDDEVLGCGGLIASLLAASSEDPAVVRVLWLSDGSGGVEGARDPSGYSARRRAEADAVAARLGFESRHLDLPDGVLAERTDEIVEALRFEVGQQVPDLILVPSPLELTRDHRAAFAALYDLLAPLRDGDPLHDALRDVTILAYEVNRPLFPDLLVDVGGAPLEAIAEAMALYASQQERHDYLAAALGLRRYRTHTLAPAIEAAEGYNRLELDDFRTRSLDQLARHLGASPRLEQVDEGPLVTVIVRTFNRPSLLAEALDSLAQGVYRRVQVVVVNDGGAPVSPPQDYPFALEVIESGRNQGRALAAEAGVAAAQGEWIAFLDDDDLAAAEHLATLVSVARSVGEAVVYSDAAVGVYELAESGWECVERRLPYSRDFDPDRLLVDNYIPFNTLLIRRRLLEELRERDGYCFDPDLSFFEDWDCLIRLSSSSSFVHLARVTCEYRHFRGADHHVLGGAAVERSDFSELKARVLDKHRSRLTASSLAATVMRMRQESVDLAESAMQERRRLRARLDGEVAEVARLRQSLIELRNAYEALEGETQRLYDDERALRSTVDEQGEHLGRTYGEIDRLGRLIEEMEQTRAWRWHQRLARFRGGS